ncbi:hypothetical protein [Clavibacter californiensis]|uniref:hypothetical protein n=1 Tax=Clavibacter californiensis TaxID=1401995 RepID=UPI001F1D6F65|nr:hypothetical protein [Clavibacter californiensis]UKF79138.1 hypothetical protein FGD68_10025 [Clavibacter californiensis]
MPSILADAPGADRRAHGIRGLSTEASICYEVATGDDPVRPFRRDRGSLVCLASVDS